MLDPETDGAGATDRNTTRSRRSRSAGRELLLRFRAWRVHVKSTPQGYLGWRIGVGVVGTLVLCIGVVLIPYPGPGWLIVFAGLGILASEFTWAHRLLTFARGKYNIFSEWLKRQNVIVQSLFGLGTFIVVVLTLWVLGALHLVAGWVGLQWDWLASPIFGR